MGRRIPFHSACAMILIGWVAATGCDYAYDISISNYDPARACQGNTFLGSEGYPKALYSIDMMGNLLWSFGDLECEDFWDFVAV